MSGILEKLDFLGNQLNVDVLSVEMKIIAYLYFHGATPSQALQMQTAISPAGFHNIKNRLRFKGVIVGTRCDKDRRIIFYNLSSSARILRV